MKNRLSMFVTFLSLILIGVTMVSGAEETKKKVTVITGNSTADGASQVRQELLEECIVSLPSASALEAIVESKPLYLKEINGEPERNEFVKTYSATIEINYMIHQKALIVVTTNSIESTEPTMKVVEKNLSQTKIFTSNSSEGDIFAGRSNRQYYFSTEQAAVNDAKKRAATWLAQQNAIICKK